MKQFKIMGEAFPLAEDARWDGMFGSQGVSVSSTGILAFRTASRGQKQLQWFSRTGKPLETVGPAGNYQSPALSRDETKIAVALDGHILFIDLGRGAVASPI